MGNHLQRQGVLQVSGIEPRSMSRFTDEIALKT